MSDATEKIADLLEALESRDKPAVRAAADALTNLAAESLDLRRTLERELENPQRQSRWCIAYILGHLPQPSGATVQILLDGLDHPEPDIRWAIALLLVRMAKAEGDLVHSLIELCTAGTPTQRRMAIYCLRDLKLTDVKSLEAVLDSLLDSDAMVRVAATTSLKARRDINALGRQALLRVFLNDAEMKVRNAAAITLARLGSPSDELLSALRQAGESENPQIRKAAAAALDLLQIKRSAPSGS